MRYAKLKNGYPIYAPNPIVIGDRLLGNPEDSVYVSLGYKPLRLTEQPEPQGDGYYAESWDDSAGEIVQRWSWVEDSNISDDQALSIILGGM